MASMRLAVLFLAFVACMAAEAAQPQVSVTTCAKAAKALGISPDGNTLFCPTDDAFAAFAKVLGLPGAKAADLESQLLQTATANPDLFKMVLKYHVVPGVVVPAAKFKDGEALATLLPGAPIRLVADEDGWDVAHKGPANTKDDAQEKYKQMKTEESEAKKLQPGEHSDEVVATDLTFDGPYSAKSAKYIVHAIDEVMLPPTAEAGVVKLEAAHAVKPAVAAVKHAPPAAAAAVRNAPVPKPNAGTGRKMLTLV